MSLPTNVPSHAEINATKLLDYVISLAEKKANAGQLVMRNAAIDVMIKHDIAKPSKVIPNADGNTSTVVFRLFELNRYTAYNAAIAGLKIAIDGTVTNKDGVVVPRDAEF